MSLIKTLCALFLVATAVAQAGMPTLEAARFQRLEEQLARAQEQRDAAALDRLLAQDFELRHAAHSGELQLREEWLQSVQKREAAACRPRQLMPRIVGSTAIVSFVCATGNRGSFVVDIWREEASGWILVARYLSPLPAQAATDTKTKH